MDRKENGVYLKHNGHNCAQAVILSFKDILNEDELTLKKLGSGFGVGMGNMEATCGALVGANIVLGLLNDGSLLTMRKSRALSERFKELSKALTCKTLKGVDSGVMLTSCDDCIRNAIQALEELLGM